MDAIVLASCAKVRTCCRCSGVSFSRRSSSESDDTEGANKSRSCDRSLPVLEDGRVAAVRDMRDELFMGGTCSYTLES